MFICEHLNEFYESEYDHCRQFCSINLAFIRQQDFSYRFERVDDGKILSLVDK